MSSRVFVAIESGKDVSDFVKDITSRFSAPKENLEIYPDPTGDPTKHDCQKKQRFVRSSCWLLRSYPFITSKISLMLRISPSLLRKRAIPKYIH
ncbi:hypothetical protein RHMOL_Rhmol07G0192100 [Rhododendron molle]|uniref:Uncharacterized protein n=1 Tax=Rhododendron molle TaxID=49168 RepID=A0ACC0N499_RHOML|nr:hypothetical protein RHMOL_Rhmol07G0192100 [Rhododendron molle]